MTDLSQALRHAADTMEEADRQSNWLARLLVGRLRKVGSYYLKQLKAELRDFDSRTGRWKS